MIAACRSQQINRLKSGRFDLLVVGGGIVGGGIARDAAIRGLSVALIEQGDFASGTSSKTSKLIHGGLRYLEQGHLRLVCESLRERRILQDIAPELVRAMTLMLPVYSGARRSAWKIRAGLALYDLLSLNHGGLSHRMLSTAQAVLREPGLLLKGLQAAGLYGDCQMDDARLCLANVLQAERFGAMCGNYFRLVSWLKAGGQLAGGVVEDRVSGQAFEIQARCVINATGPWSDQLRRLSDARAERRLSPTKGIHLVVPRVCRAALFLESRYNHRLFFILPWESFSLIGTTESAVDEPLEALRANAGEVDLLLEEANRALPQSRLSAGDVIAAFAGARPLLRFAGKATQASREHRIEVDASGLISVLGGKYTTFRLMAEQAVDRAICLKRLRAERCLTDQVSLMEPVHGIVLDQMPELVRLVSPETLSRLIARYGVGATSVLRAIAGDAALIEPACPHHPYLGAEVVYMIQQEMACTVSDVLARRTHMACSPCRALDALPVVEDLFERYGGLTPHQASEQSKEYQRAIHDELAFQSGSVKRKSGQTYERTLAG